MADWVDIVDSALDPDAPLTSELAFAWRDNVIALAEGSPGAPRIATRALKSDAPIARLSGSGAVTGLGDFGRMEGRVRCASGTSTGSTNIDIRLSSDGGSTWTGWATILQTPSGASQRTFGAFTVDLITGAWSAIGVEAAFSGTFSGSNFNAIEMRRDGNLTGGNAQLDVWATAGKEL